MKEGSELVRRNSWSRIAQGEDHPCSVHSLLTGKPHPNGSLPGCVFDHVGEQVSQELTEPIRVCGEDEFYRGLEVNGSLFRPERLPDLLKQIHQIHWDWRNDKNPLVETRDIQ